MTEYYINAKPRPGMVLPIGTVLEDVGGVLFAAMDNYLYCDGASYPISAFPELYAAIGNMYSTGVDGKTFNVPDLRARIVVGADWAKSADQWWMRCPSTATYYFRRAIF